MNRDDLILSCDNMLDVLVRKYNNNVLDEDLKQTGYVAVIKCVDRCLKENITDDKNIKNRCFIWARNAILNSVYSEKYRLMDNPNEIELMEDETQTLDDIEFEIDVRNALTPKQTEIFDLLFDKDYKEIQEILHISQPTFYEHLKKIKNTIKTIK